MRDTVAGVFRKRNLENKLFEYYCKYYLRDGSLEVSRITKSTFELYRKKITSLKQNKKNNINNT